MKQFFIFSGLTFVISVGYIILDTLTGISTMSTGENIILATIFSYVITYKVIPSLKEE